MSAMVALANGRDDEARGLAEGGPVAAAARGQSLGVVAPPDRGRRGQDRDGYRQSLLAVLSNAQLSALALADVIVSGLHST